MTNSEIKAAAQAVVQAHIDAINRGDRDGLRGQLIGADLERPFQLYVDAMMDLRPVQIRELRVGEPQPTAKPPGPRTRVRVYARIEADGRLSDEELPVWVFTETGNAMIASRIRMRKRSAR